MSKIENSDQKQTLDMQIKMLQSLGRIVGLVLVYALLLVGTVQLCKKGYQFCYEVFGSVSVQEAPGKEIAFQVEASDTMKSVSKKLEEKGLIVNQHSFLIRIRLMGAEKKILHPGIYLLNTSMDYEDVINQLTVSERAEP